MKFCGNCGSELEQGSSFCTICGYRINASEENWEKQRKKSSGGISEALKLYVEALDLSGNGIGSFLEKGSKENALTFLVSFIVLQGISLLWSISMLYNNLFDVTKSILIKSAYKIGELVGERLPKLELSEMLELQSMMNVVKSYFPFNAGKILLYGLFFTLCMLVIIILGLFIAAKLIDRGADNTEMILKTVSIAVIPLAYGGIAANAIAYISVGTAAVVYLVALFISMGLLYTSSKHYLFTQGPTEVAVAVVLTITLVLMYKLIEGVSLEAITNILTSISSYI